MRCRRSRSPADCAGADLGSDQAQLRARRLGHAALRDASGEPGEPPALDPAFIAAAMRTGSCDLAIAVLTSTASQPSSIASAASDAVPIPASSTTGTGLRVQISSIAAGLARPRPEPISEPSGITAAQPTSASFWQVTGSSLQ